MALVTPVGDITTTGWTVSGAGSIHAALADASDSSYATTLAAGAAPLVEDLGVEFPAGTHSIEIRPFCSTGTVPVRVRLLNTSGVSQGESTDQNATTTPTTLTFSVTTTGVSQYLQIVPNYSAGAAGALTLNGAALTLNGSTLGLV